MASLLNGIVKVPAGPTEFASAYQTGVQAFNSMQQGAIEREYLPAQLQMKLDEGRTKIRHDEMQIMVVGGNALTSLMAASPKLGHDVADVYHDVRIKSMERGAFPQYLSQAMAMKAEVTEKLRLENARERMALQLDVCRAYGAKCYDCRRILPGHWQTGQQLICEQCARMRIAGGQGRSPGGGGGPNRSNHGTGDGAKKAVTTGDKAKKAGITGDGAKKAGSTGDGTKQPGSTGDGPKKPGSTGDGAKKAGSTGDGAKKAGSTGDGDKKAGSNIVFCPLPVPAGDDSIVPRVAVNANTYQAYRQWVRTVHDVVTLKKAAVELNGTVTLRTSSEAFSAFQLWASKHSKAEVIPNKLSVTRHERGTPPLIDVNISAKAYNTHPQWVEWVRVQVFPHDGTISGEADCAFQAYQQGK